MSIKALSISKIYKTPVAPGHGGMRIEALVNVSMDINEGTYTLIQGPTGSGKSTLLALLAGISPPSSGEIVFNKVHLSRARDPELSQFRELHVGYIPQTPLLLRDLTLLENILLPHSFLKRSVRELRDHALQLLDRLSLRAKSGFKPHELSEGEKKKAMVARALVKEPLFLFADEPVSELDDDSSAAVLKLLSELQKKGSAVVIATHTPLMLKPAASMYRLSGGRIVDYRRAKA